MLATQFLLLHEGKIDPRRITGLTTYQRSDKGVEKASGSATNVQDWVDQSRVPYTFEEAVYEQLCLNPGFEVNLDDWTEYKSATGTTAQSTEAAKYGTGSLKVEMTNSSGANQVVSSFQRIAALADQVWSFSVNAYITALSEHAQVVLYVSWQNAALEFISAESTIVLAANTDFALVTILNKTAPALTAWAGVSLRIQQNSADNGQTGVVYFDGVQAVKSASLPNVYSQGQSVKNSFDQRTTAKQPVVTPAVFRGKPGLTFDGTDDLLRSRLGPYLVGSSGLVMALLQLTSTASQTQRVLSSADQGTGALYYLSLLARRSDADPHLNVYQTDNDAADNVEGDTTTVAPAQYLIVWRSSGSAYSMRRNQRSEVLTVAGGGDTGDWFADTTLIDNVIIGGIKYSSEAGWVLGHIALLLDWEPDPGMGARMQQIERMIRQRGLRCLR